MPSTVMRCPRCLQRPVVELDDAGLHVLAFVVQCRDCKDKLLCGRGITEEAAIAQWNDKTSKAEQS